MIIGIREKQFSMYSSSWTKCIACSIFLLMKNFLLALCLFTGLVLNAHDINSPILSVRQWNSSQFNKAIEGSFLCAKDGLVELETMNHQVVKIPLHSLSQEDQAFVERKQQHIASLNQSIIKKEEPVRTIGIQLFQGAIIVFLLLLFGSLIWRVKDKQKRRFIYPLAGLGMLFLVFGFAQKTILRNQNTTDIAFLNSAFNPFIPAVHTFSDADYFYVESQGIPQTHPMMVGISNHGWQQQVPIPQCYLGTNAWPIPLNTSLATNPIPVDSIHFTRGAIAIAVNGVPIFNVHTNTGVDSYLDGQLDNYGGHCGRGDDYHYHTPPLHLYAHTQATLPIAFGLDGFAVYGSIEPDGSAMSTLDVNHGHFGTDGIYHYHGTTTAPYMIANMVGNVVEDATHQLIPQAAAHPVRPGLTPLNGALITDCSPHASGTGYTITYTLNGATDSVVYNWDAAGHYTFDFYTATGHTTSTYNGFVQCVVPTTPLSISTELIEKSLQVFANQNNHSIQLNCSNSDVLKSIQNIAIYDIRGGLVYQSKSYVQEIPLAGIASGVYVLHMQVGKETLVKKLALN